MRVNVHLSARERFWLQVQAGPSDQCWPWTGALEKGYGRIRVGNGKRMPVHRWAYTDVFGPVTDGMVIDHLCRNRACCNPAHLEPVDNRTNLLRGETHAARNAAKTQCVRGHDFTEANTYVDPLGKRICRKCRQDRKKARRERERQQREGERA